MAGYAMTRVFHWNTETAMREKTRFNWCIMESDGY